MAAPILARGKPMPFKTAVFNLCLIVASLAVGLVAAEGLLRLKNQSMQNYDIEMWRYAKDLKIRSDDPVLDHEHRKNASAVLQSVNIRTNEWGMRGGPVPPPAPSQRRILFLGSSITLGWGVPEEDTVTARLERRFRAAGEDVVVMNAGVGNYNAARSVELFFTRLEAVAPTDIVMHFFLRDAEELEPGGGNWLLRNSELAVTLWTLAHQYLDPQGEESLVDHYRAVYKSDAPGFIAMKASLKRLADYARAHGIRLYLTMIPDIHNLTDYPFGFAHEAMAHVAAEYDYRYLDLLPFFGKLPPEKIWAMPGDPHPNSLGHEIMADAIYPLLTVE
jgi:lysophospholipase L1-like esterase